MMLFLLIVSLSSKWAGKVRTSIAQQQMFLNQQLHSLPMRQTEHWSWPVVPMIQFVKINRESTSINEITSWPASIENHEGGVRLGSVEEVRCHCVVWNVKRPRQILRKSTTSNGLFFDDNKVWQVGRIASRHGIRLSVALSSQTQRKATIIRELDDLAEKFFGLEL